MLIVMDNNAQHGVHLYGVGIDLGSGGLTLLQQVNDRPVKGNVPMNCLTESVGIHFFSKPQTLFTLIRT